VFRGPQTTAQGVNSIAGAVYVTTRDPTYEPEADALALAGSRDQRRLAAAASGPIIADELAARLAVESRRRESFVDFDPPEDYGADPNDLEADVVRGKLLWQPKALPGLSTKLTFGRGRSEAPQTELVRRPFSRLQAANDDGAVFRTIATTGIHDLRYALGEGLVLSNRLSATDIDVTRFAVEGQGDATIDGEDYVNETTLGFTGTGGWLSGVLGSYLQRTDNDEAIDLSDFLGTGDFDDRAASVGLFGEATYEVTDRLDVTLGLRYQRDSQDREGALGPFVVDFDESFDAFLPKLAVGYDLTGNVRVGGIASRGFNPGGTTISFATGNQDRFDEETVWNYELFVRSRFLDDRLGLNANAFYADYSDFQRSTFTGFSPTGEPEFEIDNADKARSYGLELDAELLATDRLRLTGSLGLLDTELVKFSASADEDVEGTEFARAPDVTATAGAAYEILDGLTLAGQVRYSDGYFSDDDNVEEFETDSYVVADFRLSYEFRGVEAFAFVDNAFDEFYVLSDFGSATVGQPREFGAGLRLRF
jgi:iron complex outermembrane recepter protein